MLFSPIISCHTEVCFHGLFQRTGLMAKSRIVCEMPCCHQQRAVIVFCRLAQRKQVRTSFTGESNIVNKTGESWVRTLILFCSCFCGYTGFSATPNNTMIILLKYLCFCYYYICDLRMDYLKTSDFRL